MAKVQSGPLAGLVVQILVLAGLAGTVGLSVVGWLVGIAYGVVVCALLIRGLHARGTAGFGPADWVTAGRGTLVGGVAALTVDSFHRSTPVTLLVVLTVVALALDGVDGQVARRTGTTSQLGARFDMEVDAVLLMVLSVYVAPTVGGWVLAIGGMRYVFVAAMWVLPWLRGPLPPRHWRKVVAATQGVALVVAAADVLPRALTVALLAAAVVLLVESFGRDVRWRWRHRDSGAPAQAPRALSSGAPAQAPRARVEQTRTPAAGFAR